MSPRPTRTSIGALRQTLAQVEEQAGLAPDDVSLIELKRILLNRIVELEGAELGANAPKDGPAIIAALNLAGSPSDQPAVAVAVDLAITLLTDYLSGRHVEPFELAAEVLNGPPEPGSKPRP